MARQSKRCRAVPMPGYRRILKQRGALLATVFLASSALCASALPAAAQDATWLLAPGSADFNTAANWTPGTVPTGTAFFGTSGVTAVSFSAGTTVGGGNINNIGYLYFYATSTAGSASITNNGSLTFSNTSTAGSATIANNSGLFFTGRSTAGSASITNVASDYTDFSLSTGPHND